MKKANFQLNTYTILCMRYLAPAIPLELVVQDYFTHLDIKTIKRRANLQDLPFPVFKLEETKKSPWMVRLEDFAIFLDKQYILHKHDYDAMHSL
ncbi:MULTISPECIES: pyocin activator PrtN family protein [Acinetobacter calcoaceticus/baumannii complex]|uniref:pyocin activator PrtN family protein n=1 Tax=Acinetobacter calcoaceticus/baumannii complex TaxID=909768 RepID=UPI001EFD04FF|nr:pyocin activator PrtN family protein [Acinetobacter nosocomialis]MCG9288851.1 pyocin activator PrtN family protein [Acinetobacter nosocomialis]